MHFYYAVGLDRPFPRHKIRCGDTYWRVASKAVPVILFVLIRTLLV